MTVKEYYERLEKRIPLSLREPWDNDGLMCCADESAEVRRALVTLDVTEEIVDFAIENGYDLIVSHHPLIFRPVSSMTEDHHVSRKLIKLLASGISVFSFHTRADKVEGGVNDCLADLIGLSDVTPFGESGIGRIGTLDEEMSIEDFSYRLKEQLNAHGLQYADGYSPVHRVAVVGGSGKEEIAAAMAAGADTLVSGRIGYHEMQEASEMGINLIEGGHYFTEYPVTSFFAGELSKISPDLPIAVTDSYKIKLI